MVLGNGSESQDVIKPKNKINKLLKITLRLSLDFFINNDTYEQQVIYCILRIKLLK